jgi:hypothetical protein
MSPTLLQTLLFGQVLGLSGGIANGVPLTGLGNSGNDQILLHLPSSAQDLGVQILPNTMADAALLLASTKSWEVHPLTGRVVFLRIRTCEPDVVNSRHALVIRRDHHAT